LKLRPKPDTSTLTSSSATFTAQTPGIFRLCILLSLRIFSLPMSTSQPQARRATIDDLSKLTPLWRAEGLAAHELEKRFKEFQLIEGPDGDILGNSWIADQRAGRTPAQ
jgi:hypothetical protein